MKEEIDDNRSPEEVLKITPEERHRLSETLVADGQSKFPEPPSVEDVLAYRAGELSSVEEERMRDHLLAWPEFAHAVFAEPSDVAMPESTPEEIRAGFAELLRRLKVTRSGECLSRITYLGRTFYCDSKCDGQTHGLDLAAEQTHGDDEEIRVVAGRLTWVESEPPMESNSPSLGGSR